MTFLDNVNWHYLWKWKLTSTQRLLHKCLRRIYFYWVSEKCSFGFKVKTKDTLVIFTKNSTEQCVHQAFCFTIFCNFSGNFIIPSSQNFLSFWAKNCSRCLLQSSRDLKFFPLRILEDQNKCITKGAMSGEHHTHTQRHV